MAATLARTPPKLAGQAVPVALPEAEGTATILLIDIEITDDGIGFEPAAAGTVEFVMTSMLERMAGIAVTLGDGRAVEAGGVDSHRLITATPAKE